MLFRSPIIALNKSDLTDLFARALERLAPYSAMGYTVLELALEHGRWDGLMERLQNKTSLILGPSGTGKSTLINQFIPNALVSTGEISHALNSGKHTTTSTNLYWMDAQRRTALIDSPGFQEFGLHHIDAMQLAA